jgi:Predicted acyl esterases
MPMLQEAKDGHDVVEWLAQQSYCNGKVTMWGGSYAGYDQWATAKEFPPHLATIVPVASPFAGVDFPRRNNIAYPYDVQWLTLTSGHASQEKIFGDNSFWAAKFKELYLGHRAFKEIDSIVGNPVAGVPDLDGASDGRCLLGQLQPQRGAVLPTRHADPQHHRPIRRRSARRHGALSRTHGARRSTPRRSTI